MKFNWSEIQKYYDEGHTVADCMNKFSVCSRNSFGQAQRRGDFKLDNNRKINQKRKKYKDNNKYQRYYNLGYSLQEVANYFGLTKGEVKKFILYRRSISEAISLSHKKYPRKFLVKLEINYQNLLKKKVLVVFVIRGE